MGKPLFVFGKLKCRTATVFSATTFVAFGFFSAAANAQSAADLKTELNQMRQQMQQQQQLMQKMQQRLDELEKKETLQTKTVAPTGTAAAPPLVAAAVVPTKPVQPKPPSAPAGVGEPLPEGYVRLGETGNLLKVDLVAQVDTMFDNTRMGSKDLFVPSSIPVHGSPFYDSGWRSNLSSKQSIFRMDFRRESDYGVIKVVYKNNFFGSGEGDMPYNLQYLYGELDNDHYSLLVGYFLSAFTDIDAFPNTLDYEGPNSFTFKYTPQIRFAPVLVKSDAGALSLPMSLEKPNADIGVDPLNNLTGQDFGTYSRRPDMTLGLRWDADKWHLLWTNLLRDLRVESAATGESRGTNAYATQLAGSTQIFTRDSIQFWGSYGEGYANFLQDITGLGLDAAFNSNGNLKAIEARGYGAGYTHGWGEKLSSSFSYGYLRISPDSDVLLDRTLPKSTKFASANLAWQFTERTMVGAEYLWGRNRDLSGEDGDGQRLQITVRYDLNP